MPDELVVVVPIGHPWHGKKEIATSDLRTQPLLLREQGSGTRAAFEAALAQAGLDLSAFHIVGEMGSTQAIKQAVKAGVGVSVISRRAVDEECRGGLVWCLKLRDLKITRAFHIATHRDRSRSPLAEAFRSFLEAESS
jgi:DNA-binding transcriptional LysR family regulator